MVVGVHILCACDLVLRDAFLLLEQGTFLPNFGQSARIAKSRAVLCKHERKHESTPLNPPPPRLSFAAKILILNRSRQRFEGLLLAAHHDPTEHTTAKARSQATHMG